MCIRDSPDADNYDPYATVDDGKCIIRGCTNPYAFNYNPEATDPCQGYTNIQLANFQDNGDCCERIMSGCTDPAAANYNALANVDDGTCRYDVYGCTNENAPNYNPLATIDDGSCLKVIEGCMDITASNYNPEANAPCDDCCEYLQDITLRIREQNNSSSYPNPNTDD